MAATSVAMGQRLRTREEALDATRSAHPNVLLVGYNGADNTGAEAKLLVILDEVRSVLGPDACITVPSLNETNLRRYLQEGSNLKIRSIRPSLFFLDIRKFVKENDLILLVE